MSNFSQFFGSSSNYPFAKVQPAFPSGFPSKFPSGNSIIPVPGTSCYFNLPAAGATSSGTTGQTITLVDSSTGNVLRTYTDLQFGAPPSGTGGPTYQGLNAFYLDTTTTPATLWGFATSANTGTSSAPIITMQTVKLPADASTPTTVLTAAAGALPIAVSYAKRGFSLENSTGPAGGGFAFPDGLGNIILRGAGSPTYASAQVTVNMTTGAWTSQGSSWFTGAPTGHFAYYTTANGLVATGGMTLDPTSIPASANYLNAYGGCIEQFVANGFSTQYAEFSGPDAVFSMTRSCGVTPVLIGSTYLALISGPTLRWPANAYYAAGSLTNQVSNLPNLFLRTDIDGLISSIYTYYKSRIGV